LLRHYLTKAGAEVAIVENGQLACEALAAARRDGRPFSLVLMDMQMPDMDGYTAAACARAAGDTTPIVALTAHALVGDRQRCIDAGCSDYLTKPVDRTALLHACRKWADTPIPRAAA
ncbi:MAG: response regulator, partial [Phycisphaerales bacterium]|nr:response regulator [Phycisphaerales bacterium]